MSFWFHRLDQNTNKIISRISALKIFVASWGASWKLFWLPGDLVSIITTKAAYIKLQKLPGSPQEATKIFRAEILTLFLIFVAILVVTMTPKTHFEINWPLFCCQYPLINYLCSDVPVLKQLLELFSYHLCLERLHNG